MMRTATCGELNLKALKKEVALAGWVNTRRDHGQLIFIDLRDRYGSTQIVFNPEDETNIYQQAKSLKSEYVICVSGIVQKRPAGMDNPSIPTGDIEIIAKKLEILNESKTTPFEIKDVIDANEELRLKYRYLDLRRPSIQKRSAHR